jgi:hypothetical protein
MDWEKLDWEKLHELLSGHGYVAGWEWLRDDATDRPSNVLRIFWFDGGYDDVSSSVAAAEAVRNKAAKENPEKQKA